MHRANIFVNIQKTERPMRMLEDFVMKQYEEHEWRLKNYGDSRLSKTMIIFRD
jgi:hypothetical protein